MTCPASCLFCEGKGRISGGAGASPALNLARRGHGTVAVRQAGQATRNQFPAHTVDNHLAWIG
jgi:hypothetical protein